MSVKIKRGSDKQFVIKCRTPDPKFDPVDLTNITQITVKIPKKDNTKLVCNMATIPASFAKATYGGITFTAMTAGPGGNAITLSFNGLLTVAAVVNAWNAANPLNQVGHSGAGTVVPATGSVQLTGGISAYARVSKMTPEVLGKIKLNLKNIDTQDLKLANSQAIEVLLDEGDDPEGIQRGFVINDAIDVI